MNDLSIVVGQPVPVKTGDKKYMVSPMTLSDWAAADVWAEERWIADMRKRAENAGDERVAQAIRTRMATITKRELIEECSAYLDTGEGAAYRLWLQLKHQHEKITLEDAGQLVSFPQFNEVQRILLGLPRNEKEAKELLEKEEEEQKVRPTGS